MFGFAVSKEKLKKATILIIDDSEPIVDIVNARLEIFGYKTITASNGKEGLELAESEKPDLILLDVNMPVMDGYEMLELLRMHPVLKATPVIMITAKFKANDIATAHSYGISDYVVKPFSHLELVEKVRDVLGDSF